MLNFYFAYKETKEEEYKESKMCSGKNIEHGSMHVQISALEISTYNIFSPLFSSSTTYAGSLRQQQIYSNTKGSFSK